MWWLWFSRVSVDFQFQWWFCLGVLVFWANQGCYTWIVFIGSYSPSWLILTRPQAYFAHTPKSQPTHIGLSTGTNWIYRFLHHVFFDFLIVAAVVEEWIRQTSVSDERLFRFRVCRFPLQSFSNHSNSFFRKKTPEAIAEDTFDVSYFVEDP